MCGIISVIDRKKNPMDGSAIKEALSMMNERGNGEGSGYAVYGAFPEYAEYYAVHVFYDNLIEPKTAVEEELDKLGIVKHDEQIPTFEQPNLKKRHIPWRYFFKPNVMALGTTASEEDILVYLMQKVNTTIPGALVYSTGKNIAVFKAAGWPEEVADFYRIQDYQGYIWLAHNRYPTNTAGWWGGAHPFNLLDWTVVHNGEITSYGTNKRYLEGFGYVCTMHTDTEVVAYLTDLLQRQHNLPAEIAFKALAPPFWDDIDRMPEKEREFNTALRMTYSPGMMNGPFAIVVANSDGIAGITDRIKLRPLVAAVAGDRLYLSSEEAAIRVMEPSPDRVWMPRAGEPVIARLE